MYAHVFAVRIMHHKKVSKKKKRRPIRYHRTACLVFKCRQRRTDSDTHPQDTHTQLTTYQPIYQPRNSERASESRREGKKERAKTVCACRMQSILSLICLSPNVYQLHRIFSTSSSILLIHFRLRHTHTTYL